MTRARVRGGIVGARFAANFHYDSMRRVTGAEVEVVGVHARTAESAERFASARGIQAFGSLDALLDAVDVVHVCVPSHLHELVAVAALARGVYPIVEKPFTGYFGDGDPDFDARGADREAMLAAALDSVRRMLEAEAASSARIMYAENWVYAPAIQKEREIIEKTGAQVLWMLGEEAHSGSHSDAYGFWRFSGGGSAIGKGVHPLGAGLYLKRVEGRARLGRPIRPTRVTARTHELTRVPGYEDRGHLRTDYHDVEDFALLHVEFDDGTVMDVFASEVVMGGVHRRLEVAANNHRTICNIAPTDQMRTYNPDEAAFGDIYVVEKIGTRQGWMNPAPDEDFTTGFPQEVEAFYRAAAQGSVIESDSGLGADTVATVYAGYVSAGRRGAEVPVASL